MTAPISEVELQECIRNWIPSYDQSLPFIGSMEGVRPGCYRYNSYYLTDIASLLKDEPVGTYLMSISSPDVNNQAAVIKSESGMKYIHNVDPGNFLATLKRHSDMTDQLAAQARPFLSAIDSYEIDDIDFSLIKERFPEVTTVLFLGIHDRTVDKFIEKLIRLKEQPSLQAFITFSPLGRAARLKVCDYLEGHSDDPNWDHIVTALMQSLHKEERRSTRTQEPSFDNRFSKFFNSEVLSDFRLIVEGNELHLHRIILAGYSEYFSLNFTHNFDEITELEVKEFSFEVVSASIEILYKGEADFSKCSLLERLSFAHYLQAPFLIRSVTDLLLQPGSISPSLREMDSHWQELTQTERCVYFTNILSRRWEQDVADCAGDQAQIKALREHTLSEIRALD